MSYEFPASVEREVKRYAEEANLSPDEAAVQLIQTGLEKARKPEPKGELTEEEWESLRADPVFAFFASLPDSAIESIEAVMRENRSEGLLPRG